MFCHVVQYCIARVILYDNQKKDCQDCGKIKGVYIYMDEVLLEFTRGGHLYFFRAIRAKCQFD